MATVKRSTGHVSPGNGFAVVERPILECVVRLSQLLGSVKAKWAIGGDAAEVIGGVNVKPDRVTIVTTAQGCDEICNLLVRFQTKAPESREVTLERQADVDGRSYPVRIRSRFGELSIENVKVDVHGDAQIRVGDWDWGDPIDFEPTYTYVIRQKVPIFPLNLKTELYLGLGWLDRIELITVSLTRAHMGQEHPT